MMKSKKRLRALPLAVLTLTVAGAAGFAQRHFSMANAARPEVQLVAAVERDGALVALDYKMTGDLLWYKHKGWQNGTADWARSGTGVKVGSGWQGFKFVFTTSDGIIYGVQPNGDLLWYKHNGWQIGTADWAKSGTGVQVGSGWQGFKFVFASRAPLAGGELSHVIYGTQP